MNINHLYLANLVSIENTMIYVVLSLSFFVVLRAGVFSFANVGFYGLAGYSTAIMAKDHVPPLLAALIAVVACGIIGFIFGLSVRKLRGTYLGLFTIAFVLVLQVLYRNAGTITGGSLGLFGVPQFLPVWALLVIAIIVGVVIWRLSRGSIGRSFEATRLNESLAQSVGIEVARRRLVAFTMSSVLGGIAGVMYVSSFRSITPDSPGFNLITLGLTMVVLGGMASWQGAIVGGILIAWLPNILIGPLQPYQILVNGLILAAMVVFAPRGVAGIAERVYRRYRRKPAPIAATGGAPAGDSPAADVAALAEQPAVQSGEKL
ncbi:MAG: branched-chain amino acid transporter permease [Subtercola sp.]|nr:branched-chain amino acid transporter permease [Subtercola sp.]